MSNQNHWSWNDHTFDYDCISRSVNEYCVYFVETICIFIVSRSLQFYRNLAKKCWIIRKSLYFSWVIIYTYIFCEQVLCIVEKLRIFAYLLFRDTHNPYNFIKIWPKSVESFESLYFSWVIMYTSIYNFLAWRMMDFNNKLVEWSKFQDSPLWHAFILINKICRRIMNLNKLF